MKNSLKIKINNLYNTQINGVQKLDYEVELVKNIIQEKCFTFDEVIDILLTDNQLLKCTYNKSAFEDMDDNVDNTEGVVESLIYKFITNNGKKLTSQHIERFFNCVSDLKKDDIAWMLLCGGQSFSLISEIANKLGIELSTRYVFAHTFVYDRGCVNLYEFQNMSEFIEDIHLQQALKLRTFENDVLDKIIYQIVVEGMYSNEIITKLCYYQQLPKDLVVKYKDDLDWIAISNAQYFDAVEYIDYEFFRKIKDYMIWGTYVAVNPVSEKLYKIFADKLSWEEFKTRQQVTIDSEEIQLTIDKLDKFDIYDYNRIFCHHAIMTPKQTKLVRLYHKILLYSKHGNNNYNVTQFLAKLMLFFGCDRYFDNKLRHDLKKGGFQVEGDYVIGYVHKDFGQCINNRSYEQGLTRSYAASYEIIENSIDKGNNITVKVKVNIHDIHHTHYYYYPKTAIASIKANKFQFI